MSCSLPVCNYLFLGISCYTFINVCTYVDDIHPCLLWMQSAFEVMRWQIFELARASLCFPLLGLGGEGTEAIRKSRLLCKTSCVTKMLAAETQVSPFPPFAFPALCTFLAKARSQTLAVVSVAEWRLQLNTFKYTRSPVFTFTFRMQCASLAGWASCSHKVSSPEAWSLVWAHGDFLSVFSWQEEYLGKDSSCPGPTKQQERSGKALPNKTRISDPRESYPKLKHRLWNTIGLVGLWIFFLGA